MKRLAKLMLLTLGIGVVAVVLLSLPRHTAAAASDPPALPALPVTVTNTPNVDVTNTANVHVTNTPNVNATVTGTVGINGTPTVNVASAPPVSVTFPASIAVQDAAGITHLGQDVKTLVTLSYSTASSPTPCTTGFQQILPNGAYASGCYPGPGAGNYLVVTDLQVYCGPGGTPGGNMKLIVDPGGSIAAIGTLDATGSFYLQKNFTTGVVFDHAPVVEEFGCLGGGMAIVTLEGYVIPAV